MKKIFLIILSVLSIVLVVALSITLANAFRNSDIGSDSSVETNEGSDTISNETIVSPQDVFPIKITNNTSKTCSTFTLNAYYYKTDDLAGSCTINEFIVEPGQSIAIWPAFHYFSGYTKESSYISYIKSITYDTLYLTLKDLPRG